jgi:hypothetical protein
MGFLRRVRNVARYYLKRPEHLTDASSDLLDNFIDQCRLKDAPKVLELGTRRSYEERSTRHDSWVPHASTFIGADIELAEDVDLVADVHRLTETTGHEEFDIIISCSSFEHFKYPHLAAHEIMKAMKIGGLLFIQTHQSYPLHASPHDYFRFSRDALSGLFGTRMGFEVIATSYDFPVRLKAKESFEVSFLPAYLNTCLFGRKLSATPDEYLYDYDVAI